MAGGQNSPVSSGLLIATFLLDHALFGIDATLVQEVVQVRKCTAVHHAPRFVRGVMNLRGRVITLIDLSEKLILGSVANHIENRILVVEWKQEYVGLLVDRVTEVVSVEGARIKNSPGNVHGVQADLIAGVFQNSAAQLVALLDVAHVLDTGDDSIV